MKIYNDSRETYSQKRIHEFQELLKKSEELKSHSEFCVYVTGSYGRLEASKHSDLDLFFLYDNESSNFPKISKTLIDAHIINSCRQMDLPEFSKDGAYLEIHNSKDIYNNLGSQNDDYFNFFTARMLLLLESKVIHNELAYEKILRKIISIYYKDFNDHEKNFKPAFMVNDVIRFWRTMCLNYEHNRNRKGQKAMTKEEKYDNKIESHIKNLKLRFSRKLTCYSFLLSVLYSDKILTQEHILEIINQTPLQRLQVLHDIVPNKNKIEQMITLYFWFLDTTQTDIEELKNWIANNKNRDIAFSKSRDFAKTIFNLMIEADKENLMYFLV